MKRTWFKNGKMEAGENAIPVDVEGADLLYVALAGAHSIIPAAAVFNAAGENWTLSFFEAVNFGAFVGDPTKTKLILDRIVNEAKRSEGQGGLHLRMRHRLPGYEAAFRQAAFHRDLRYRSCMPATCVKDE